MLENSAGLTPTYRPSAEDIENRVVVLTLHARGKDPIEDYVASDSMEVHIIHNALVDLLPLDTACENSGYQISDVIYQDVDMISWSSSGDGYFNGTRERNPLFSFSLADRDADSIYFYVEVNSALPCTHVDRDTLLIRIILISRVSRTGATVRLYRWGGMCPAYGRIYQQLQGRRFELLLGSGEWIGKLL